MNSKESFNDYQYNQKLYDIIISNIAEKSFEIGYNKEIFFHAPDLYFFNIYNTGRFYRTKKSGKKILSIPFGIRIKKSEFGFSNFILRGDDVEKSSIAYLFVIPISDGYVSIIQCRLNTWGTYNIYEPIKEDIVELSDFIRDLKDPKNIIDVELFKYDWNKIT